MMRMLSRTAVQLANYVRNVTRAQVRTVVKARHQEHVTTLTPETLIGRMLLYLNIDKEKRQEPSKNTRESIDCLLTNNLQRFTIPELVSSLHSLDFCDKRTTLKLINKLDVECCLRLNELNRQDILSILGGFMGVLPNRITELRFYQFAIEELFDSVESLSKSELLQLIFYVGLQKKNVQAQTKLRKCMKIMDPNFVGQLTTEELCIVCNSNFKTSTKIRNKIFLNKVRNYLNDNLIILKDPALFVTLLKTIRHNRYQDENLLSTISTAVFFNKTIEFYSFATLCHILAVFADFLYYDQTLLTFFTKKCLAELEEQKGFDPKNAFLLNQPRGKDIKRLLWGLSNFCHYKHVDNYQIETVIIPKLLERIQNGEFDSDIGSLVDIALYLWILNYRPYELVPYILTKGTAQLLHEQESKSKERLNLLLYCIYVEDRNLFNKLKLLPVAKPNLATDGQIGRRHALKRVFNTLKILLRETDLNRFELSFEVPYIDIVGITGYRKNIYKAVYVEVLDSMTSLKNVDSTAPTGLMDLKLRLLDRSEEALIVITQEEIGEMTESELHQYLLDEIKLVC